MTTQTNGDELERAGFDTWFEDYTGWDVNEHPSANVVEMMWQAWQAALSSKQEEV